MRFQKIFLGALAALAASLPGSAQTPPNVRTLTLQECVQLALQNNLALQISRIDPQRLKFDLEASYQVYDPTFTANYGYQDKTSPTGIIPGSSISLPAIHRESDSYSLGLGGSAPVTGLQYDITGGTGYQRPIKGGAEYNGSIGVSVTQPLLRNFRIDNSRLSILLAKKDLRISELTVAHNVIVTVTAVEQVYYELIAAEESVKVQEKALQLAEKLYEENRKRVEVGALAPLDEKQSASQVASRRADLLSAQQSLGTQQNVIKKLLSNDYATWHSVYLRPAERLTAEPVQLNLEESWKKGLAMRPDFLQSKQNLERQDLVITYQKNQLYPSLNLVGGYNLAGSKGNYTDVFEEIGRKDSPTYTVGLQLSMPLSNRGPRNRYQSSKASREQLLLSLKDQEQTILVTIDNSIKVVQSYFEKVHSTKEARVYAEAALDAEQKKLENGKSTSFQVLQLQRDLTDARSQEIRALADYNKSLAQLASDEGSTLERNHIVIENLEKKK